MSKRVRLTPVSEIPPGEGRTVTVEGRELAVFHTRTGCVYVTQARCPHRQGPLADGLLGANVVVCPLHEWKFDLETGKVLSGDCNIQSYPAERDPDGFVTIELPG